VSLLMACAPAVLAPPPAGNVPPETPVAEAQAMQTELQARWPTIWQMACFSSKAYETGPGGAGGPTDAECPAATFAGFAIQVRSFPWTDAFGRPHSAQYLVATNATQQIIAMRGTSSDDDARIDLEISKSWDKKLQAMVHTGFQTYAQAVYQDLHDQKLLQPDHQIILAGHSLGGAVAVLLGLYLYVDYPDDRTIAGIYTFGQPRLLDNFGTTSWPKFADRVLRMVDCDDVVPTVPTGDGAVNSVFAGTYFGNQEGAEYQHFGRQLVLLDYGQYWMPRSIDLFRPRKLLVNQTLEVLFAKQQIDHAISKYIYRIQALKTQGQLMRVANPANRLRQVCSDVAPGS
jgi:hypothetical protein